jgi:Domain of unknown function (DUF4263)
MTLHSFRDSIEPFKALIAKDGVAETEIQQFMEQHTGFIPTPFLLGHEIQWNFIISQFRLDHTRKPDFAYLTKNSGLWRLVLIELESPNKRLFRSGPYPDFHSDTRTAISQIQDWKTFIDRYEDEVRRRLEPLMLPLRMRSNPLEVKFSLVIGRNEDDTYPETSRPLIGRLLKEQEIEIFTYDSIIRMIEEHPRRVRNILSHDREGYRFKHLENPSTTIFAYLRPEQLGVTAAQKALLEEHGYDMNAWSKGELLEINGKRAFSEHEPIFGKALNDTAASGEEGQESTDSGDPSSDPGALS